MSGKSSIGSQPAERQAVWGAAPGKPVSASIIKAAGTPQPWPGSAAWSGSSYRQFLTLELEKEGFPLDLGGQLPSLTIAYETYGQLAPEKDNVILVTHALTGDSHVASHGPADPVAGWWEGLVGPGRPLDTRRYSVVCSNVLGGCYGTTGPSSINPRTNRPYATDFPLVTVRDMVRAQHLFLKTLGIDGLFSVIGGSLGGMQALQWAVTFPGFSRSVIAIGAPGKTSPQSIAFNEVGRQAIMADPSWQEGHYYPGPGPRTGLAIARMLGMITYHSHLSMEQKFGRRPSAIKGGRRPWLTPVAAGAFAPVFAVESYLHHQGVKLVRRFDANTYLYLTRAMDLYDLGSGYASLDEALAQIRSDLLVVGIDTDILYPVREQLELVEALRRVGVNAQYREMTSPWGHDAFLLDTDQLGRIIADFLGRVS